ncbi:MAG: hypothetical protein MUE74_13990, partial [Bacteroidales bacterium]|nr:hypothetical protein [Bacteroidales bacterium]
ATPLWRCMNNSPSHEPYSVRPVTVDLNDKNIVHSRWQQMSEKFDFTAEDRIDDAKFNEVIWKAVKGLDSPCPPAVRSAFLIPETEMEED